MTDAWAERDYLLGVRKQDVLPTVVQRFVDALCPAAPAAHAAGPSFAGDFKP